MSALAVRRKASWLTDAAFACTDTSVWAPRPTHRYPATGETPVDTPDEALAEVLTAIVRCQHEHRERTAELTELATYYRPRRTRTSAAPTTP
ncbi:hypothetical protein AB0B79_32825 [Streptomyces sp. NPDC039022]|uniref:hypothetical protein n=1 Tax=Streptomyces sp. NPDC039022 TaxID=3157091 RepID=UPI0033DC8519